MILRKVIIRTDHGDTVKEKVTIFRIQANNAIGNIG